MASIYVDGSTGEVSIGPDRDPGPVVLDMRVQQTMRGMAYINEADPLFFKWQAGEATKEEWLAKREEIRSRYPYPANEGP